MKVFLIIAAVLGMYWEALSADIRYSRPLQNNQMKIQIVLPNGNGMQEPVIVTLMASETTKDEYSLVKIRKGRKTIRVAAFLRNGLVYVGIGSQYTKVRQWESYQMPINGVSTDRQELKNLRGSWYDQAYLRVEKVERNHHCHSRINY